MRFIKKLIQTKKIFTIVDIGTYKIRCNIVEIERDSVTILWYGEKKQEPWDFYFWEIQDIDNVSRNLGLAIKKAEKEANEQTKSIVINSATFKVFYSQQKLVYRREEETIIKKNELKTILESLLFSLKNDDRPLQSGVYWTKDMKLVLWNIRSIVVDGKKVSNLLNQYGKDMEIVMNQFFMEMWKYAQLRKLAQTVWKKVELVLPYENTIKDLVNTLSSSKDYVVINIWNAKTHIVIVRDENIIASSYFNIGIGELIDNISSKYKITNIKAIKTIDTEWTYETEKKQFYDIWESAFKICLEDALWNGVCPYEIYMFGGWYNKFIEENMKNISFSWTQIKLEKWIEIKKIDPKKKDFINGRFQLDVKSNFSLVSMIISITKYCKGSENEMVHMLQKMIKHN